MTEEDKMHRVNTEVQLTEHEKWAIETFWAPIIEAGSLPDNGDGYEEDGEWV